MNRLFLICTLVSIALFISSSPVQAQGLGPPANLASNSSYSTTPISQSPPGGGPGLGMVTTDDLGNATGWVWLSLPPFPPTLTPWYDLRKTGTGKYSTKSYSTSGTPGTFPRRVETLDTIDTDGDGEPDRYYFTIFELAGPDEELETVYVEFGNINLNP